MVRRIIERPVPHNAVVAHSEPAVQVLRETKKDEGFGLPYELAFSWRHGNEGVAAAFSNCQSLRSLSRCLYSLTGTLQRRSS